MKYYPILLLLLFFSACGTIKTEHTVHITMDVNLRIEKELEDFFGDLDSKSETLLEEKL
jgi:hypothetical protein